MEKKFKLEKKKLKLSFNIFMNIFEFSSTISLEISFVYTFYRPIVLQLSNILMGEIRTDDAAPTSSFSHVDIYTLDICGKIKLK